MEVAMTPSGRSAIILRKPLVPLAMLTSNMMNWLKEGGLRQKKVKRTAKWVRKQFLLIAGRLVKFGFPLGSDRGILNTPCVMI
jgi:hypothetical protein